MDQITEHLADLAQDLYQEGYACGISGYSSEKWFSAWAEAMRRVVGGEAYTKNMVIDIFKASC
jgi:hypothetical protein